MQNGQVQAGALSKSIFENLISRKTIDGAKFHTVAVTPPIPNYPMVLQGKLDAPLKEAIRSAFLDLKDPRHPEDVPRRGLRRHRRQGLRRPARAAKILNLDLGKMS